MVGTPTNHELGDIKKRLLAAATAALVTLVVGGCGASGEPVEVTGMLGAYEDIATGEDLGEVFTERPCEGWQDWQGNVHGQTWSYGEDAGVSWVSDERVAGEVEFTMDADVQDEGDTCVLYFTGTETITNDNGTWEGTWEGTSTFGEGAADDEHFHDVTYTLLGTGDYDGLEFVFHMEGFEHPWPLDRDHLTCLRTRSPPAPLRGVLNDLSQPR